MAVITLDEEYQWCQRLGVRERFEAYLPKRTPEQCWLWQGSRHRKRKYGRFAIAYVAYRQTLTRSAHRVAWQLYCGPIPPGLGVLHHCDNPPCVNPFHLFVGTQSDNSQDMVKKGRAGNVKLTDAMALEIIDLLALYRAGGCSVSWITRQYPVDRRIIQGINSGHRWRHLPRPWE